MFRGAKSVPAGTRPVRGFVIAVKDGRLYSSGLPDCGLPVSNLWLDKEGRPDQERSYLRRFLRVYRVMS